MAPFPGSHVYLVVYNIVQLFGWATILSEIIRYAVSDRKEGLWSETSSSLKLFQTLAVLEVGHTAVKLVKSSTVLTAFQIASRLFVLWAVLDYAPASRESVGFALLVVCWTLAEMVRYAFYITSLLNWNIYPLLWLRYSMFIVLYPLGVTGELVATFQALPKINAESPLAFSANFNWAYYATILLMLMYIPVFPKLYGHMLSQRRKALGLQSTTRKKLKK